MNSLHPGMKVLSNLEVEYRISGTDRGLATWLAGLPTADVKALRSDETDPTALEILDAILAGRR